MPGRTSFVAVVGGEVDVAVEGLIDDSSCVWFLAWQVLTASVPKEIPHLATLMSMGDGTPAVDAHEPQRAAVQG
jgi:hypothetical protein